MLFHGIHTPMVLFCILMQQKKTQKTERIYVFFACIFLDLVPLTLQVVFR